MFLKLFSEGGEATYGKGCDSTIDVQMREGEQVDDGTNAVCKDKVLGIVLEEQELVQENEQTIALKARASSVEHFHNVRQVVELADRLVVGSVDDCHSLRKTELLFLFLIFALTGPTCRHIVRIALLLARRNRWYRS